MKKQANGFYEHSRECSLLMGGYSKNDSVFSYKWFFKDGIAKVSNIKYV